MRLTYVHEVSVPGPGANTVHVLKMCDAFAGAGADVMLITPGLLPGSPLRARKVQYYYGVSSAFEMRCIPKLMGNHLFATMAARYAAWRRSDVLYSRHVHSCLAAARRDLPTIFEAHVGPAESTPARQDAFRALVKESHFRRLVVISKALRDAYLAAYPTLEPKTIVAHDGADDPFRGGKVAHPHSPSSRPDRLTVGYVGHLYPGKGMEIISAVAPRCPWADFHIVGGLPDDVRRWKQALSGVPNVLFYGHLPHAEIGAHIQRFDVVLAPYLHSVRARKSIDIARWMSPLKIFEYMAHGKAIMSSDLPVLREVLTHGETALLCDPDDIESWICTLAQLRDDASLRYRLGKLARKKFTSTYKWSSRAERVLAGL